MQRKLLTMTSDTVRQKYIYNTPYDDNEFPLVLEDNINVEKDIFYTINASFLYSLEEEDFKNVIQSIKSNNMNKVIIRNNLGFKSSNKILINASLCYIMSFVYLFKKSGLSCRVI